MPTISYQQALEDLKSMFPDYDEVTLKNAIEQYNYNMELIVSVLLGGDDYGANASFSSQNQSTLSGSARREIETIETEYGLDLHQNWRTRLPKDLLIFDHQNQPSDEELARRLQNEYDEQASERLLRSALRDTPPSYRNTEQPYESSISDVLAKKTKALKDKFKNFWYERKGYQRVNVSEGRNGSNENGGVSVCA